MHLDVSISVITIISTITKILFHAPSVLLGCKNSVPIWCKFMFHVGFSLILEEMDVSLLHT